MNGQKWFLNVIYKWIVLYAVQFLTYSFVTWSVRESLRTFNAVGPLAYMANEEIQFIARIVGLRAPFSTVYNNDNIFSEL